MSELEIRLARGDDAATVLGLVLAFRDHLQVTEPGDAELAARLPEALADPGVEFACAWLRSEPVGYTQTRFFHSIWTPGVEAHLADLFVVGAARGEGIGSGLLRHALDRARERGARLLGLTTNERNERSQRLYRAAGLRPQAEPVWGDGREIRWVIALPADEPDRTRA